MKLNKAALTLSSALIILASACSTGATTPTPLTINDAAATLVALTFESVTQTASASTPTPLPSPLPSPTAQPMLYINVNAKCRSGVTSNFKVIATFTPGMSVELIGRDTPASAWLVRVPNSADMCWVSAQDGSPAGNFQSLPEVTPQPVAGKLPTIPGPISWPYYCTYLRDVHYKLTIQISWMNIGHDANGFRVYRNDVQIADVPADITTIKDETEIIVGTQLRYSVEAYNDAGASPRQTITTNQLCTK